MKNRIRIPLLKDHHNHPSLYAVLKGGVDLRDTRGKEEALELISGSKGDISLFYGWNDSRFDFTESEIKDMPPVFIWNESLHGYIISDSARGVVAEKWKDLVDRKGDLDWIEENLPGVVKFVVNLCSPRAEDIAGFYDYLVREGIWYAEEMLLPSALIVDIYREAGVSERTSFWADPGLFATLSDENRSMVRGIKIWADGALGARTAAISSPYRDGSRGKLLYSSDRILDFVRSAREASTAISIHAIGDLALEQVLSVFEDSGRRDGSLPAVRLEHCQFISKESALRARELGAILSMQPNFNRDSIQYADRLPEKFLEWNNPFRMLIDDAGFRPGEDLILGSDGMPHGARDALEMSLFPPYPGQELSVEEFAAGYCMPDMQNGYIDVVIDEDNRSVETEVVTS